MQGSSSQSGADEPPPPGEETQGTALGAPQSRGAATRSQRRLEWWLLVGAAIAAVPLWYWRGSGTGPGTVIEAPLSLITADRHELSCALPTQIGRYRCAFRAPDEAWPEPPAPVDTLTQYLTTDRRLMLVPGLFEQPEVAERYAQEPPEGVRLRQLRRFVATCKVRLVRKVPWVYTRWSRRGNWDESGAAWVAEPLGCNLRDE